MGYPISRKAYYENVLLTLCFYWHGQQMFANVVGSSCGSVGRADASGTRGPRFRNQSTAKALYYPFTVSCIV